MDEPMIARSAPDDSPREERECRSCLGTGYVPEDPTYDPRSGELLEVSVACPICDGLGRVSVYRYRTSRRRGR